MRVLVALLTLAAIAVAQPPREGRSKSGCSPDDPLDIVFVVDSSGSIQEMDSEGWQRVKTFIVEVTKQFTISPSKTRVGLTVYSEFATRQRDDPRIGDDAVGFFDLNTYKDARSLQDAINRLYYFNSLTNTQDGLNVAHSVIFTPQAGDRASAPNLAIVITDGVSNVLPEAVEEQANRLKQKAIVVAVGVHGAKEDELRLIASNPSFVYQVEDFASLIRELDTIISTVCGAVAPPSDPGRCCDFDGEYAGTYCDFEQDGITRFSLRQGPTPSYGTGPQEADSGLYYAYLEASNLDKDDSAELRWSNIRVNGTCLSFAYNMFGNNLGQLFLEIRESSEGDWVDIWNVTEATEEGWQQAILELNVLVGDLRFRGVRGDGYQGDIALDTIRLTVGPCFEPEPEPANDTDNATCPEPQPPLPPIIYYPFFQPPGSVPEPPKPPPPPKEEEEEVDLSKSPECIVPEPFQVLLVGGPNATVGRVEVFYNNTFATVCNSSFTDREAAAVCRSAGFYGGRYLSRVPENIQRLSPDDDKPIFLDNIRCKPGALLSECCRSAWGKTACDHSLDVYVQCDERPYWCNPQVEGSPEPPEDADYSLCDSIAAPFSVILRDGAKPNEGRVEIYYDGQFGTVCNDTFGVNEAMAVCRSLGYYAGNVWRNPPQSMRLEQGVDRPVLLSSVRCDKEVRFGECCFNAIGYDDGCTHESDAFVRCYTRPEYCLNAKGGCANPAERKRPEPEPEPEPEPPGPPKPQIFPIPVNPYFAVPFGQQLPLPPFGTIPPLGVIPPPLPNPPQQGGD